MPKAHTMAVARDPTTGAALPSATVNVYTPGTVTPIPATIYDKNNNVLVNPLTSDPVTGLIDFYLTVPQEVDLVVAKAGYTTRTYSNVPVLDDASLDLSALLTTTGDVPYASTANVPARLPIGTAGQVQAVVGGIPAWVGGAWTAFTPTVTQSGAVTVTVTHAEYQIIGKTCLVRMRLVVTGSGTTANSIDIGLPAAIAGKNPNALPEVVGAICITSGGGGTFRVGAAMLVSAQTIRGVVDNNVNAIGIAPAFGLAANDLISLQATYELP